MCGRYALYESPQTLKDFFATENAADFAPHYNAAPAQTLPVVIRHRMGMAVWGFSAHADARQNNARKSALLINARSETADQKTSFRHSWQRNRTCLIPVSGFYEWHKTENRDKKDAYYIYHPDQPLLALAGLWQKTGDTVEFTILTKEADSSLRDLHHRMPVIIHRDNTGAWFAGSSQDRFDLITGSTAAALSFHRVSPAVGSIKNDNETLIEAVS